MSTFNELCTKMENMDDETFNQVFNELSARVLYELSELTENGDAYSVYLHFILAAVAADGKLTEEEFNLIRPIFINTAGHDVDYQEGLKMFKDMGLESPEDFQEVADLMADVIELASPEAKDDIVLLSLMICAIDGDVSDKEKKWIAQLIEPLDVELTPMETVNAFLEKAGSFVLATCDGEQPRMRVLGFKTVLDVKIYFGIGTFKDVYKQLQNHPRCEILAFDGEDFMRWDGKAVFSNDQRLALAAGAAMPEVTKMYIEMGWNFAFFTLEEGTAEIVGVDNSKTTLF